MPIGPEHQQTGKFIIPLTVHTQTYMQEHAEQ